MWGWSYAKSGLNTMNAFFKGHNSKEQAKDNEKMMNVYQRLDEDNAVIAVNKVTDPNEINIALREKIQIVPRNLPPPNCLAWYDVLAENTAFGILFDNVHWSGRLTRNNDGSFFSVFTLSEHNADVIQDMETKLHAFLLHNLGSPRDAPRYDATTQQGKTGDRVMYANHYAKGHEVVIHTSGESITLEQAPAGIYRAYLRLGGIYEVVIGRNTGFRKGPAQAQERVIRFRYNLVVARLIEEKAAPALESAHPQWSVPSI